MQLKKTKSSQPMKQGIKPIFFYSFGKGWYAFQGKANVNLPMLKSVLGNSHFFFRIVDFYSLCLYVRIGLVLDFFLKIGGLQEPSQILFKIPRKKSRFWGLAVLSNLIIAGFLDQFSQARSQKLQFVFWKCFLCIIFLDKK
jgi:hypothetical protein